MNLELYIFLILFENKAFHCERLIIMTSKWEAGSNRKHVKVALIIIIMNMFYNIRQPQDHKNFIYNKTIYLVFYHLHLNSFHVKPFVEASYT